MKKLFKFGKEERLSHKNQIDSLFNEGRTFNTGPFKVIYRLNDASCAEVKILVAVAKKKFKKAVDRNKVRRLIREAYRLNKHLLIESVNTSTLSLHIGFIYIDDKADISFMEIEKQMIGCLEKIRKIVSGRPALAGILPPLAGAGGSCSSSGS
jgi:ribonuclease P protein component